MQGCIAVFVAGAAAGGLVVYDRRTIKTTYEDQHISYLISNKVYEDNDMNKNAHIVVETFNHVVLLAGQVPSDDMRQRAQQYAESTPGIARVYNEITVSGLTSPLTRSSDAWITSKARALMLATKGLKSTQIKTVTENGTVYLMGVLSPDQAELAVNTVRRISGVQRVVKIFEYK